MQRRYNTLTHARGDGMLIPSIRWLRRTAFAIAMVAALVVPVVVLVEMPAEVMAALMAKVISPLSLPLIIVIGVEATLVLVAAIWWLWWRLPRRQVRRLDMQIHDPKARADVEDNFRKTVGQA